MNIFLALFAFSFIAVLLPFNAAAQQLRVVTFESNGQTLAGHLYLPDDYTEGQPLPAAIVTGSWTSVKEQMAGGYAREMAVRGYAALAFDFRGWGESNTGGASFVEDPQAKTEDIIAAARFLATVPEIDAQRIAGLGICASAGYVLDAALESNLLRSVAVVAPWLHDAEVVDQVYGGEEGVSALIEASREAEERYRTTGQQTLLPAASDTDPTAVMQGAAYYTDINRGLIPEYDNQFNTMTWEPWLTYDAIQTAENLQKPTLLVHSQDAAIPQGAQKYLGLAGENTRGVWLDGVTQFDFYDQPAAMQRASDEVAAHFTSTL